MDRKRLMWSWQTSAVPASKAAGFNVVFTKLTIRFDVLILDANMPVGCVISYFVNALWLSQRMNGDEAAAKMRAAGVTTPIMALTGALGPVRIFPLGILHSTRSRCRQCARCRA